jgi:hypothetical protein
MCLIAERHGFGLDQKAQAKAFYQNRAYGEEHRQLWGAVAGLEALRRTMPSASGRCPSTSG